MIFIKDIDVKMIIAYYKDVKMIFVKGNSNRVSRFTRTTLYLANRQRSMDAVSGGPWKDNRDGAGRSACWPFPGHACGSDKSQ